jgi:hypothetical protein
MGLSRALVGSRRVLCRQLHQSLFSTFFQKIHIDIAVGLDPVLVRFNRQGPDEPETALLVRPLLKEISSGNLHKFATCLNLRLLL